MLVQLVGWGDITGDSAKTMQQKAPTHGGPGVVQHGGTTKLVTCKDFDFNFTNARITGNVVINIPHVGSIFCGEKNVASDHSSYKKTSIVYDKVSSSSTIKTYKASRKPDGGWNLELVKVTAAVERDYHKWQTEGDFKKYLKVPAPNGALILLI